MTEKSQSSIFCRPLINFPAWIIYVVILSSNKTESLKTKVHKTGIDKKKIVKGRKKEKENKGRRANKKSNFK